MTTREEIAQAMLATPLEQNPALPPESWNRGVRNVTTGALSGLSDLATFPGRYARGETGYTPGQMASEQPQATQWAPEMATNLMGGGVPMAKPGSAGMFGGRLGLTGDLPKLMKAEDMALDKQTPRRIWNETGWVQRPDRQWRYEIPDENAAFDQLRLNYMKPDARMPISEVFRHRGLYEAYPELKDIQFGTGAKDMPKGALGGFMPERMDPGILRAQAGLPPKYRPAELIVTPNQPQHEKVSTALHELQHAIQTKEGFARGGAPAETIQLGSPEFKIFKELRNTFQPDKLQKMGPEGFSKLISMGEKPVSQQSLDKFVEAMADPKRRAHAAEYYAKVVAYQRLLGESEARLTQTRGAMTAAERRATFPELDVPTRKQIIRMRD